MAEHSNLLLVNKENPLPADYIPPFLTHCRIDWNEPNDLLNPKQKLVCEAAGMLEYLCATAMRHSVFITGVSGYRSFERQKQLYDNDSGNAYLAAPGFSEHQTGLAVDLSTPDIGNALKNDFEHTDAYRFLLKQGPQFGFILRYPRNSETVTGYPFESWHFRYVGRVHAMAICEHGMTLEEYLYLQNGKI